MVMTYTALCAIWHVRAADDLACILFFLHFLFFLASSLVLEICSASILVVEICCSKWESHFAIKGKGVSLEE